MPCIYFQGMNEIVGPIYYVFATDSRKEWRGKINVLHLNKFSQWNVSVNGLWSQRINRLIWFAEYAEADCFFCFTNIMSDIRDFFIKSLDEAESGINAMMGKLMARLENLDPDVKDVLDNQGIRPQYFSFR